MHRHLFNLIDRENHFLFGKTLERAAVKGYIPTEEVAAVKEKIQLMADSFKFSPDDFAKVVLMESDGFNPKASNGRCHGIIQFCDGDDRGAVVDWFVTPTRKDSRVRGG